MEIFIQLDHKMNGFISTKHQQLIFLKDSHENGSNTDLSTTHSIKWAFVIDAMLIMENKYVIIHEKQMTCSKWQPNRMTY